MLILIETRKDGRKHEERLPLDESELAKALARLDGSCTTLLTITMRGNDLFVGGGNGRYTVTSLMSDGESHALVGDRQVLGDIDMVICGQRILQPVRYIVNADRVLKVVKYFSKPGGLDDGEVWEEP